MAAAAATAGLCQEGLLVIHGPMLACWAVLLPYGTCCWRAMWVKLGIAAGAGACDAEAVPGTAADDAGDAGAADATGCVSIGSGGLASSSSSELAI
jgi:hypothetical protein